MFKVNWSKYLVDWGDFKLKDKFRKEKYYMLYLCCYKSYIGEESLKKCILVRVGYEHEISEQILSGEKTEYFVSIIRSVMLELVSVYL